MAKIISYGCDHLQILLSMNFAFSHQSKRTAVEWNGNLAELSLLSEEEWFGAFFDRTYVL